MFQTGNNSEIRIFINFEYLILFKEMKIFDSQIVKLFILLFQKGLFRFGLQHNLLSETLFLKCFDQRQESIIHEAINIKKMWLNELVLFCLTIKMHFCLVRFIFPGKKLQKFNA